MRILVAGPICGQVLVSRMPINFLGMVNKKTGTIEDPAHDLNGISLAGRVLVFPHGIGSSVGAYTIYSIKAHGAAPAAMVCEKPDLTVASGCALAGIPMAVADRTELGRLRDGQTIEM